MPDSIPPEDRETVIPEIVKTPVRRTSTPSFKRASDTLQNARTMMPSQASIDRMKEATRALQRHNTERQVSQKNLEKHRKSEEERLGVPLRGVDGLKDPGKGPPAGLFKDVFKQPDPVPPEEEKKNGR
jgi:hypothetical protein